MKPQSSDTDPKAETVLIEGLRRLRPEQRFALADRWTRDILRLSWAGLCQRHPGASEDELRMIWVSNLYGPDLAERVRVYLAEPAK